MKDRRSSFVAAAAAALCFVAGSASAALSAERSVTIPMKAVHGSNQDGIAVLTQLSGGVRVAVTLRNAPLTAEPTHLHAGACGNTDPNPAFALKDAINGKSVTTLPGVKLNALLGRDAIVVHKSLHDLATYVSCGSVR